MYINLIHIKKKLVDRYHRLYSERSPHAGPTLSFTGNGTASWHTCSIDSFTIVATSFKSFIFT